MPTNAPVKFAVAGVAASSDRMLASKMSGSHFQRDPSVLQANSSRWSSTSTRSCTGPGGSGIGVVKLSADVPSGRADITRRWRPPNSSSWET